jgi:sugar phosphate isomerase/epimerase
MKLTRRGLITAAGAALALPVALHAKAQVRFGVCDWNLRKAADVTALDLAASIGFEGVEVSLGRNVDSGKLPLDDPAKIAAYREKAAATKLVLTSTCLDVLHRHFMKSDPLGLKYTADAIRVTKALGAGLILLPYFGKGALTNRDEMARVADMLKEVLPDAERANVVLALENTISAEDNAFMIDRAGSSHLKMYYDVGNSTNNGFDVVKEIRWLGTAKIGQIHFKDRPYLGEGKVPFPAVAEAMHAIGYKGFVDLETGAPSGDIAADMARNLAYSRKLLGAG